MSDPQPDVPGREPTRAPGDVNAEDAGGAPAAPGISLDQLNSAFAEMLGTSEDPPAAAAEAGDVAVSAEPAVDAQADEAFEVTPRSILEAMLFVGNPDNEPLSADRVASLLRGVSREEVDALVVELGSDYAREGTAFEIKSEGAGYRMVLRDKYRGVRDRFYGRVRQAKLSQAAIEVLSVVAYNQPVTADQVNRFRDASSGSVLTQLVGRALLRIERPRSSPRNPLYFTTDRFLQLFGLESVDDLPRSEELDGG